MEVCQRHHPQKIIDEGNVTTNKMLYPHVRSRCTQVGLYKNDLSNTFCPPHLHHEPKIRLHRQQGVLMLVHPQGHR
jgi:hypothetical protein